MKATRVLQQRATLVLSAAIVGVLANVPTARSQATTETWSLGASGLWNVAANWSADAVPNNGTPVGATYNAYIVDGTSTVTLNTDAAINDLRVGVGNTLEITPDSTLYVAGSTLSNKGSIQLSSGILALNGNVTLSGSGTLSQSGTASIEENASGVTLTNQSVIQGGGVIGNGGLALINSGTIDGTSSGGGLTLNGGPITNTGSIEATSGGTLTLSSVAVNNTGGNITASGTSSVVSLTGATITGGTLNSSTGGAIVATSNTTLAGVTISAGSSVTSPGNSATFLSGTTTNEGTIQLNGGAGSNTDLILDTNVTLTGGGKVVLNTASGGGNVFVLENTGGLTLTNSNNTIEGSGLLGYGGLTVVNSAGGTISSNVSAGTLLLSGSGGLTNSGTLQVSSGALLHVSGGPFSNFSGTKLTGGTYNVSGTLEIDELGSAGGEIVTDDANIILDGTAAKFVDDGSNSALTNLASITSKGSFTLAGGADFTTAGTLTNRGTLSVGAGSIFDVDGTLSNLAGTALTGGTYDVTGTLEFAGANIETNDAAITLTGKSAEIVNTTTGKSGLAKFANNDAAGMLTIEAGAKLSTVGSVSNAGSFTIGAGSTLTVGGRGVFTQTAGTTTDSGTLAASGGVALSGGSLFAGGTITGNLVSSGVVTPGASATKTGILTDTGTYTQNSGGSLDIGIGGATAAKFDALNATSAALGGTLNISELSSFIPTVGSTFKILTFNSVTGTFATVNGLTINSTEAYTITYQATDVLLTVVSAASPASRLGAAVQEFNAAAGRYDWNDRMAPRPRLERIRAVDLIKKGARQ